MVPFSVGRLGAMTVELRGTSGEWKFGVLIDAIRLARGRLVV